MAHVTSIADPQVIVAGLMVNRTWHYMKSAPMPFNDALRAVQAYESTGDSVAFMRAADDPEVANYPTGP